MNSGYIVAYHGTYKVKRHFVFNNIIWFEKCDSDIKFRTVDGELYKVLNTSIDKFKAKFKQ